MCKHPTKFTSNVKLLLISCLFLLASVKTTQIFEHDILVEWPSNNVTRIKRAATAQKERIWDYGVVPYVIDGYVGFSGDQKAEFVEAMQHWENFTCIKFVERNASIHDNFIRFTKLDCGCCSHVGKQGNGGQNVSIGKNCHKKGVIVHELGHAIGFWHEHTRPDRDEHVKILSENILTDHEHNFLKLTYAEVDSLGEPYDYGSIMHYARNYFSKHMYDSKISTIQPKKGKNGRRPRIGQREHLSPSDIRQTNKLYKCPACGETYLGPQATFTSPNYKSSSSKEYRCEWRISATHGERILLNISDFDMFQSAYCKSDYLEVLDGYWHKSPLLGRFCGPKIEKPMLISTGNRMVINYISVHSEYRGFSAKYEAVCGGDITIVNGYKIESPNYPQMYLPNKECIWRITVPPTYQVAMEFHSFDLEVHSTCRNDFIEVRDGDSVKSRLIGKYCGNSLPPILASTKNKMYIRFVSDESTSARGFSAVLFQEIDECTLKEHGCEQNCINTLDGYTCACRLGYKLRSDGKTCEVKCGGVITTPNGTIQSPSFPYPYPANEECVWEIVSQEPNRITLNFTHFELEGSQLMQEECDYDSVAIASKYRDGRLVRQGIFCSELLPPSITSETNVMRIKFQSDKNVQKMGFSAIFTTNIDRCAVNNGGCKHICGNTLNGIKCSCKSGFILHENGQDCVPGGCRYEITAPEGIIQSPNYPQHYFKNTDCIWHFKAIHGHRPILEFQQFDLEDDYDECTNDYVTVYVSVDPLKRIFVAGDIFTLGTYCGSMSKSDSLRLPPVKPVRSPSDDLFMAFKTDASAQRKGFQVKHSTACGGHFDATSTTKYIYSHARFGDTFYDNNTSCEWIIKPKQPGMRIHLKFLEFDVEKDPECLFDYVELFEMQSNQDWTIYGRYCGDDMKIEVVALRRLMIRFETDESDRQKGFSVSYSVANAATLRDFNSGSTRFTRLRNDIVD
ncbi:dorsal-ventral patterning protein tolloid-like [Contarinia nasturtii]|uniref:dorsal-ventral patterning protein tolloid-like n=1 Tax=Contarinia nasturtii TaxID=265458 RepID=UPI0012D3976B|nr:dorsal-ventral patterning protein tolloid-like [Contarinia nasturtii]